MESESTTVFLDALSDALLAATIGRQPNRRPAVDSPSARQRAAEIRRAPVRPTADERAEGSLIADERAEGGLTADERAEAAR